MHHPKLKSLEVFLYQEPISQSVADKFKKEFNNVYIYIWLRLFLKYRKEIRMFSFSMDILINILHGGKNSTRNPTLAVALSLYLYVFCLPKITQHYFSQTFSHSIISQPRISHPTMPDIFSLT